MVPFGRGKLYLLNGAILNELATLYWHEGRTIKGRTTMKASAQTTSRQEANSGIFASKSRTSWIGSKIIQSLGVEAERLDEVHNAMWLRILRDSANDERAANETDQLAAKVLAVARVAEKASATGGSNAALIAVMRESGGSLDPLLAQNFLRVAASPIFWMALDSAGGAA